MALLKFLFPILALSSIIWISSGTIFPCPSWGYVKLDCPQCQPLHGALIELTNLRTGGSIATSSERDGSWSLDLTNLPGGFSQGDDLLLKARFGDLELTKKLTSPASGSGCELRVDPIIFKIPPILEIFQRNITTCSSQILIQGHADGTGSIPKLYIDNLSLELDQISSNFSIPLELDYGSNQIKLKLEDQGGIGVEDWLDATRLYPKDCVPPHSISGRIFKDCLYCQPFGGVALEIINLRTGERAYLTADSNGYWSWELTNWLYAYQLGDIIQIRVLGNYAQIRVDPNISQHLELAVPIPPKLEISGIQDSTCSPNLTILIRYHGTGSIPRLHLDSRSIELDSIQGTLEYELELEPGLNSFELELRDRSGMSSTAQFKILRLDPEQCTPSIISNLTNLSGWIHLGNLIPGTNLSLGLEDEFLHLLILIPIQESHHPKLILERIDPPAQIIPQDLKLIAAYRMQTQDLNQSELILEFNIPKGILRELNSNPEDIFMGRYHGKWIPLPTWILDENRDVIRYRALLNLSMIGILARMGRLPSEIIRTPQPSPSQPIPASPHPNLSPLSEAPVESIPSSFGFLNPWLGILLGIIIGLLILLRRYQGR